MKRYVIVFLDKYGRAVERTKPFNATKENAASKLVKALNRALTRMPYCAGAHLSPVTE